MAILSPETLQFIRAHRTDDVRTLALQARKYTASGYGSGCSADSRLADCREESAPLGRQTEGIRYPAHLSMEQCSSEITARYKASWLKGDTMADLTGGLGGGLLFPGTKLPESGLCGAAGSAL